MIKDIIKFIIYESLLRYKSKGGEILFINLMNSETYLKFSLILMEKLPISYLHSHSTLKGYIAKQQEAIYIEIAQVSSRASNQQLDTCDEGTGMRSFHPITSS